MAAFEATAGSQWILTIGFGYLLAIAFVARGESSSFIWIAEVTGDVFAIGALLFTRLRLDRWVARSFDEFDTLEDAEFSRHAEEIIHLEGEGS